MRSLRCLTFKEVPNIYSDASKLRNPRLEYRIVDGNSVVASVSSRPSDKDVKPKADLLHRNSVSWTIPVPKFVESVVNDVQDGSFCNLIPENEDSKILIEYSSPNIAKPFHMGHLRSTLLGHFVSNILTETRKHVIKINYLGDWGTQFGLVLAGLGATVHDVSSARTHLESLGCKINSPEGISNCDTNLAVREICNAYVKANEDAECLKTARELTSAMERGTAEESLAIWQTIRMLSLEHLKRTYTSLGISFDEYIFESEFSKSFYLAAVDLLRSIDLAKEKDGQMVLCDSGLPLGRSDGASLYLGRDIASALYRVEKFSPTGMVYVIDKTQQHHVSAIMNTVSKIKEIDMQHIHFGKITGMSTRSGQGALLSDIMEEAFNRMSEQQKNTPSTRDHQESTTRTLALSNLTIYLLRQRRLRDFQFSWEAAVEGKGDCGSRLQYCHSRLASVEDQTGVTVASNCQPSVLKPDSATLHLVAAIANYEDVVLTCAETMESSSVVNYAFHLCHCINKCLKTIKVKGEEPELAEQRLLLFNSARKVLAKTMQILGIQPLNKM